MAALRDRTRRFWTTLLFFLFGPILLGVVGFRLYWRTTQAALDREKEVLSQTTRFAVDVAVRDFLRPGVRRALGVEFASPKTDERTIFCPEIYFVRQNDADLLRRFALSFDERAGRVDSETNLEQLDALSAESSDTELDASTPRNFEPPTLVDLLFSDVDATSSESDDEDDEYVLAVVPIVYCRDSRLLDSKQIFAENIFQKVGADAFPTRRRVLCLVVERVVFQDDSDFERTRRDFVAPTAKSTRELTTLFRNAATRPDPGAVDASTTTLSREIVAFASEEPTLENFRALYVDSPRRKRVEALFEFPKISAARPLFLSLETCRDAQTTRFEYNALKSPTPGTFAARFFPFFQILGDQGWIVGRVVASDAPNFATDFFPTPALKSAPVWTTRLDAFHCRRCDVRTLTQKIALPNFTGTISDLAIDRGALRDGVFLGSGTLKMIEGTFPQSVLNRLCASGRLEVGPPATLVSYRFMNDAVPFNEFKILFDLRSNGVAFDSNYPNKIVACYRQGDVEYAFFLPKNEAGATIPYSEPLRALVPTQGGDSFWSPLFRNALNHLPLEIDAASPSAAPPTLTEY